MTDSSEDSIKNQFSDIHLFLIDGRIMQKSVHLYEDFQEQIAFLASQLTLKVNFMLVPLKFWKPTSTFYPSISVK